MELIVIGMFCAILLICIFLKINIVIPIFAGLGIFLVYGKIKGFSWKSLGGMCLEGVNKSKNILITFIFIGSLTALWRSSACIPAIVCFASGFIHPAVFVAVVFILCSVVSILTGTSFGTAATMGVICMSIANSMQISSFWVGGAILSGIFWGDRCSPLSTSALLVASITETELYGNLRRMVRTAIVPTVLTTGVYLAAGFFTRGSAAVMDVSAMFSGEFRINWICLLPAALIVVLAAFRIEIKRIMALSALLAGVITFFLQKASLLTILHTIVFGFQAKSPEIADILNGGGIFSLLNVSIVVCVASCYAGIFEATGLLSFLQSKVQGLAEVLGSFGATFLASILIAAISCSQTLAIMLTQQMTFELKETKELKALNLEDSVVLISALIPWSIAGTVPLDTVGAPHASFLTSCFLYILPLWQLVGRRFMKLS